MHFSFFCKHCGKHLRKGDHTKCKRILRTRRKETAAHPPPKTAPKRTVEYLVRLGE